MADETREVVFKGVASSSNEFQITRPKNLELERKGESKQSRPAYRKTSPSGICLMALCNSVVFRSQGMWNICEDDGSEEESVIDGDLIYITTRLALVPPGVSPVWGMRENRG